jgi:hypothetical protein
MARTKGSSAKQKTAAAAKKKADKRKQPLPSVGKTTAMNLSPGSKAIQEIGGANSMSAPMKSVVVPTARATNDDSNTHGGRDDGGCRKYSDGSAGFRCLQKLNR